MIRAHKQPLLAVKCLSCLLELEGICLADRTALACQEEFALGFKTYSSVLQGFPVDVPGVKVIRSSLGVGQERLLQVFAHLRVGLPPGSAAAR